MCSVEGILAFRGRRAPAKPHWRCLFPARLFMSLAIFSGVSGGDSKVTHCRFLGAVNVRGGEDRLLEFGAACTRCALRREQLHWHRRKLGGLAGRWLLMGDSRDSGTRDGWVAAQPRRQRCSSAGAQSERTAGAHDGEGHCAHRTSPAATTLSSGRSSCRPVQPRRPSTLRPRVFPIRAKWHCDDMDRTRVAETLRLLANRTRGLPKSNHVPHSPLLLLPPESAVSPSRRRPSIPHSPLARSLPATADCPSAPSPNHTLGSSQSLRAPARIAPIGHLAHQLTCPVPLLFRVFSSSDIHFFTSDARFAHPSVQTHPPSPIDISAVHTAKSPTPGSATPSTRPIPSAPHEHLHSTVLLGPGAVESKIQP